MSRLGDDLVVSRMNVGDVLVDYASEDAADSSANHVHQHASVVRQSEGRVRHCAPAAHVRVGGVRWCGDVARLGADHPDGFRRVWVHASDFDPHVALSPLNASIRVDPCAEKRVESLLAL